MKNKTINIGIFCDSFYPMVDGVINIVDNYARRLNEYANVTVFVSQGREKNYIDNFPYKVVRCKKKMKWPSLDYDLPLPELDTNFMDEIKKSKLDIVHIHSPFSIGKIGVKYAKKHKIPVIATCHSQFKKDFLKETKSEVLANIATDIIMQVFNACDEVWTVNEGAAKMLRKEYILKAPLMVQYSATDLTPVNDEQKARDEINKLYNLKNDDIVLLYVGRIHVLKNIFFICDTLKILKENNFNFKMLFVGTGPDYDKLKLKIKELNLDENVILIGKVTNREELVKIYTRSDLFLFPSTYDTDGLVKYEAACAKTPVLTLKNIMCSSNVIDNVNGYLEEFDVEKYAKRIIGIFTTNKEKYKEICENCHRDLYITWDKNIETIYNRYLSIIEKYKNGHYKKLKKFAKDKASATKKIKAKQKKAEKKQIRQVKLKTKKLKSATNL